MIFERQEEDRDLAVALAETTTRAIMRMVAGAAGWAQGVQLANDWSVVPKPPELANTSDIVGRFAFAEPGEGQPELMDMDSMADEIAALRAQYIAEGRTVL